MSDRKKRILVIITTLIMMIGLMPPFPVRGVAGVQAIPKALDGAQVLMDTFGILGGLGISHDFNINAACWCTALVCANPFATTCPSTPAGVVQTRDYKNAIINHMMILNHGVQHDAHVQAINDIILSIHTGDVLDRRDTEFVGCMIIYPSGSFKPPDPEGPGGDKPPFLGRIIAGGLVIPTLLTALPDNLVDMIHWLRGTYEDALYMFGLEVCPITGEIVPIGWSVVAPHPNFRGYHESGLPLIYVHRVNNNIDWSQLRESAVQHNITEFTYNGIEYSFELSATNRIRILGANLLGPEGTPYGFFACYNTGFVKLVFRDTNNVIQFIPNILFINVEIKTQPAPQPAQNPFHIAQGQPNILTDTEALIDLILQLAHNPDNAEQPVVFSLPLLEPQFFPEIAPEHFPEFAQEIISTLTVPQIVVPGTIVPHIPNLPQLPQLPVLPQLPTLPGGTQPGGPNDPNLARQLRYIEIAVIMQGHATVTELRNIHTTLRQLNNPVIPILPELPEMEFDFSINLMDYFPFSIPRDIYQLFSILLGGMPVHLAGASTQQLAIYYHYQETGFIAPQHQAMMAPIMQASAFTSQIPRFEMHIPLPDFSGGNLTGSSSTHTFVFDMADHMIFIRIINVGVYVVFLIGLMKATSYVITW